MSYCKLTREERVQALYDLKVGQVLSLADIETVKMLSRMALAAMDSEPVAWTWHYCKQWHVTNDEERARDLAWGGVKVEPLYRHAQPASVVPDDVLAALQKVARIRLDLNDFDGDCRGIADCLGDAEEALIEVVNRRAAMLAAAPQPQKAQQNIPEIIPGWIPVSERMPENDVSVLTFDGMYKRVHHAMYGHWQCWEPEKITHWMPLPAAPQEVR